MELDQLYTYCLSKKKVTAHFPFDKVTLVFKVMNKMFALISLQNWEKGETKINLKCNPNWAEELRNSYSSIQPGYHMNKKHWNTVTLNKEVTDVFAFKLIDHSYNLVVKNLTKKEQKKLADL